MATERDSHRQDVAAGGRHRRLITVDGQQRTASIRVNADGFAYLNFAPTRQGTRVLYVGGVPDGSGDQLTAAWRAAHVAHTDRFAALAPA